MCREVGASGVGNIAISVLQTVNDGLGSLETAPAYVHLAHLLASGCGVPLSEDALCVSSGAFLARSVVSDGLGATLPRALEVVLALYVGVVVSDLITYGIGSLLSRGFASGLLRFLRRDPGVLDTATNIVGTYGRLIGFVERFFIGFRGAIALMSGFTGVPFSSFGCGVALGAFVTLPMQLGVGYVLRDCTRPYLTALAMVATPNVIGNVLGALLTLTAAWRASREEGSLKRP